MSDEIEVYVTEFLELKRLAELAHTDVPLQDVVLYNPTKDEEYGVSNVEAGVIHFHDDQGKNRSVAIAAISQWSVIFPTESVLNSASIKGQTTEEKRRKLIFQLSELGVVSGNVQTIEDLQVIKAAFSLPLHRTNINFRRSVYQAIKKLENEPLMLKRSFELGFKIMEQWLSHPMSECPPDYLIQLAYYRRWCNRTNEALEVTSLLENRAALDMFTKYEAAVLATERAAAYMDKFEKTKTGLDQAHRFLKLHHMLKDGNSDAHNANAWKRYDALKR